MGKRVVKWFRRFGSLIAMVVAMLFFWQASAHRKKQAKLADRVRNRQEAAKDHVDTARSEKYKAGAAKLKAEAALFEGQSRIEKLKENGDEDLAARADAFNNRLRQRNRSS